MMCEGEEIGLADLPAEFAAAPAMTAVSEEPAKTSGEEKEIEASLHDIDTIILKQCSEIVGLCHCEPRPAGT